ncbi:unnamed protein product [Clavelina lepadiformis]|uniref:Protein Wnt n=1 Tax=Clavelina lepadiformis TaxID=159417 RepID=A0ABP0G2P6_CLALP
MGSKSFDSNISRFPTVVCKYRNLTPLMLKIHVIIYAINVGAVGIATAIQWLSISKALSLGIEPQPPIYIDLCEDGKYLSQGQKKICRQYYSIMSSVVEGATLALTECQRQFENEKWNCSTQERRRIRKRSLFGRSLTSGTRESAFVYAVSSAAVAFSVTRDCRRGHIDGCGCDMSWPHRAQKVSGFDWSGCSDNIAWGAEMSRVFIDAEESTRLHRRGRNKRWKERKRARNEMTINLNNNRVGRESVEESMTRRCKCHGTSGSCIGKTCWRTLPDFEEVGRSLKTKYKGAAQVHVKRKYGRPFFKAKGESGKRIINSELVFLRKSPDACSTFGRRCSSDITSPDNCDVMCCGRGYSTRFRYATTECKCKFKWCCKVDCDTCNTTFTEHTCL